MTKWYVRRREDGSIASAHQEPQPGYADEPVDEQASELTPLLRPVKAPPVDFGTEEHDMADDGVSRLRKDFNALVAELRKAGVLK